MDATEKCGEDDPNGGACYNETIVGQPESALQNLFLAHEIAINSDYGKKDVRIEDLKQKDALWNAVKEQVHSAFWDIFRSEISQDPPVLTMAFSLLKDVKEGLYAVMTTNTSKLRATVDKVLNVDVLKEEVENGVMDVQKYALFIISVMRQICAPVRDETLSKLSTEKDIVALFRGILDTLDLMKLDLINFTIKSITPEILANQMEYESTRFKAYVESLGGLLPITDAWLARNKNFKTIDEILANAFLEIITWNPRDPLPETLFMDGMRLSVLQHEFFKLTIACSVVVITLNCSPVLASDDNFKQTLKTNLLILLNGIHSNEELKKRIPNIVEQIKKDANTKLTELEKDNLSDFQCNALNQQIGEVVDEQNPIRSLVCKRVKEHFKNSLESTGTIPASLVLFQKEFEPVNQKFKYLFLHNIAVCQSYYSKAVQALISSSENS